MFYTEETVNKLKKKIALLRAVTFSLLGAMVIFTVLSFIFMDEKSMSLFKALLSVIDSLIIIAVIFIASFLISNNKKIKEHVEKINDAEEEKINVSVLYIPSSPITLTNDISVYEVVVSVEGTRRTVKLYAPLNDKSFFTNVKYEMVIANGFIKRWNVI
ncbi:MAG: hypothetical protein MJ239_01885 [Bacilli bacterium]|nr:hypothetical protein [Bacilli bacterium]